MRIFVTLMVALFLFNQNSDAQKYTFVNINSSIPDFGDFNITGHFTLGQVITTTPNFMQSVAFRYSYYNRPSYMNVDGRPDKSIFLLGSITTQSFNLSYQVKRKLYKNLFAILNVNAGLVSLNEDFTYEVKGPSPFYNVLYRDEYSDSYKLNVNYGTEIGLEYFIIKNDKYFISTSMTVHWSNNLRDYIFKSREGEFNRYPSDNRIIEPPYQSDIPAEVFWLGGIAVGMNIR